MAFPAGMQTVHVTAGPILNPDGSPVTRGTIRLRPEWELIHDPSGVRVIRTTADITLASTGTGVTDVPASDSTGLRRPGVRYWVTYELGYGVHARDPHWVYLPADRPTADLESLLPAEGPAGPVYAPGVVSVAGLTGVVTLEQLAAALGLTGGTPPVVGADGTFTVTAASTDDAAGTYTLIAATDNGDGTFTIAA